MATEKEYIKAFEGIIDRIPDETQLEYQIFLEVARLTPDERRNYDAVIASKYSYKMFDIRAMKEANDWANRLAQVDAQKWSLEQMLIQEESREDRQKFVNINREIKNKTLDASNKILSLMVTYLTEILPGKLTQLKPMEAARLFDIAVKNSRLAANLPTEIIEKKMLSLDDLENLSADEIEQLMKEEENRINRLTGTQKVEGLQ